MDHTSSWTRVHAQTASLRAAVAALDAGRPLPDPTSLSFDDQQQLLLALHGAWARRLSGRIDVALETDDHELAECVGKAWLDTADDLPGVRRALDEHADDPALQHVLRSEHRTIAVAAGLATFDDPLAVSAAAGTLFVAGLRRRPGARAKRPGWWARLTG